MSSLLALLLLLLLLPLLLRRTRGLMTQDPICSDKLHKQNASEIENMKHGVLMTQVPDCSIWKDNLGVLMTQLPNCSIEKVQWLKSASAP